MTRAPCRRRTGEAVPRAEKFGDLITADHKVLNEEGESRNNHRYAVVVQHLATQWIQSYPCKTKTSQETEKSLRKFREPSQKPNSHLYGQFIGVWQILWRIIMESSNFNASPEWYCWESGTQNKKRNVCCTVATQLGWKMVPWFFGMLSTEIAERVVRRVKEGTSTVLLRSGLHEKMVVRFFGMLLLSSKSSRPPGWWESTIWKTIWRFIQRTNNTVRNTNWISSDFSKSSNESSSIWHEHFTRNIFWISIDRTSNLEMRHSHYGYRGIRKDGRLRYSSSKNAKEVLNHTLG